MNRAVTFGINYGPGKADNRYTVLAGPEVPLQAQRQAYKQLVYDLHGQYDEVQLWTSSAGKVKGRRTRPLTGSPVPPDTGEDENDTDTSQVEGGSVPDLGFGGEPDQPETVVQAGGAVVAPQPDAPVVPVTTQEPTAKPVPAAVAPASVPSPSTAEKRAAALKKAQAAKAAKDAAKKAAANK